MSQNNRVILIAVICGALGIGLGVIIGWFSNTESATITKPPTSDEFVAKQLRDEINEGYLEEYLQFLTKEPRIAGRDVAEVTLVNYIKEKWEESGFHVEVHPYDVLLSYPNDDDSNLISVKFNNGSEIRQSTPFEKVLDDSQISDKVVNPFNAYSATGDVEGRLVYVNYATVDDFIELTRDLGVDPDGHVCISRYGKIFRGSKAMIAQDYGCTGLILYSDPLDYTVPWAGVYPDDWYLPGTGAQRGNLHIVKGDPLTPQYPSLDTAWRLYENETNLPKIPVTPIGYDDAMKYLEIMGGNEVPDEWKGGLNITYRLGPGFVGELNATSKIKMHITTKNQRAVTNNIFGYITGDVEPDAWVFGAIDPSSGTAAILELARSIGLAVKNGWKPRRTIVLCSWGAEEYGLLGSTEWVEEFQKLLSSRAVAYLNMDTTVRGNYTLFVRALPNLNQVVYDAADFVGSPIQSEIDEGRKTLYDTWALRRPKYPSDPNSKPRIGTLGSGSDFTPMIQIAGISSLYGVHTYDDVSKQAMKTANLRSYPVYHSVYETFDLVKEFVDPEFKINKAMTQLYAEMARVIIDSPILPFSCQDYAAKLIEDKATFADAYGILLAEHDIDITEFDKALEKFSAAADNIHSRISTLDTTNEYKLRAINDQLMQLDRAFIDMNGIGERINFRHVIYAPSLHNTYASSAFPGVVDSLFDIKADEDQEGRWREVRRQYSILLYHLGSAASTLTEMVPIKGYSNT